MCPKAGSESAAMTLGQFLTILWARRRMILMVTLLVAVTAAVFTALMPKRYQTSASVMVDTRSPSGQTPGRLEDIMNTQLDIIGSPAVALKVVEALKLEQREDIGSLLAEWRPWT